MNNFLFFVLVALLFFYLVKNNGNKYFKKMLSSVLIIGGIFILNPIPDASDVAIFPLVSSINGWQTTTVYELGSHFINYLIITSLIGITFILAGLYISGYEPSYVWRKVKKIFK